MWSRYTAHRITAVIIFTFATLLAFNVFASRRTVHSAENQPLWPVKKKWDDRAEKEFSAWVARLGNARKNRVCLRFKNCLNNPIANSLHEEGEKWRHIFADCADLPYILRAYFAYKTKRPFQFTSVVSGSRYTKRNKVKGFADFTDPQFKSVKKLLRTVAAWTHSGYFRTRSNMEATDTYPVAVNRKSIVPGTVFYEPRGHVLVVIGVDRDGTVHMIDGHPDNSLTYKTMTPKSARPGRLASSGGGFRNWRRYAYQVQQDGTPVFTRETNAQIISRGGHFNAKEQYQRKFVLRGKTLDYWSWVRERLRTTRTVTELFIERVFSVLL